jgi:hypothetical protein
MAKTLAQLIFDIATKAGIPETDPELIALTENQEVFKMNVPDKLVGGIESQLISIKDAKNNHPDIKSHYTASALDGVDKLIAKIIEEYNDEPTKAELLAEKNTYNRLPLLAKKIKELESKKANAAKGDQKGLQEEIDKLNGQIREVKEQSVKALQDKDKEVVGFKKNYLIKSMLQGYKTTLDELDGEVRATTLSTLLNKELQDNKAQLTFDENDNLILLKQDGSNYYGEDNKQVDAKAFLEKTLSRNKLLKVTDQNQNGNGDNSQNGQRQQANAQGGNAGSGDNKKNHTLSALAQGALKNLQTNANVSVMG